MIGEVIIERLDQCDHVVTVQIGFRHRFAVPSGVVDFTGRRSLRGHGHQCPPLHRFALDPICPYVRPGRFEPVCLPVSAPIVARIEMGCSKLFEEVS